MIFNFKDLDEEQQIRYKEVENVLVFTEEFSRIDSEIKHQHERSKHMNYTKKPKNIMIMGPSGVGKSAIVEYYRDKYPARDDKDEYGEITKVPVLYLSLPDDKNVKAAPRAILKALGEPDRKSTESRSDLNIAFKALARDCGVEVIIIDEVHNAYKAGTNKELVLAANWFKTLINDTKIPMVLVGLNTECKKLLSLDSELETRFQHKFELSFYSPENFNEWLSLLESLDEKLPFPESSNLCSEDISIRLFSASEGRISYLMDRIIRPASQLAIFEEAKFVTLDHMFRASQGQLNFLDSENPLNGVLVPLKKVITKVNKSKEDGIPQHEANSSQGFNYSTDIK